MQKPTRQTLKNFLHFGVGTSIYQMSCPDTFDLGHAPNQWDMAQQQQSVPQRQNPQSVWHTLEMYLPILAKMGIHHLRFSVEWSFIEPQCGQFNLTAIKKYQKIIEQCHMHHIEPMLTLCHFTQPQWFIKMGGFEHEKNIEHFLHYCQFVIHQLSPDVKYWCTINEPAVEAFSGYLLGQFPPHHRIQWTKATHVLKNMLKAHVDLCQQNDKKIEKDAIKIGLVHNILRFESDSSFIARFLTAPLTHFTDELVMEFMATGTINYKGIKYSDPRPKGNCFFINIYGGVQVGFLGPTCQKGQLMGDMYIAIYPESYHLALSRAQQIQLPIYITETGMADQLDKVRPQFLIEFIRTVLQQIAQGNPIERIYFWTFKDNYEWNLGHQKHFGLFNLQDEPRTSAYVLAWLIQAFEAILNTEQQPEIILHQWHEILNLAEEKLQSNQSNFFSKFINL